MLQTFCQHYVHCQWQGLKVLRLWSEGKPSDDQQEQFHGDWDDAAQ